MTDRPRTLSFALSTKGFTFDLHFSRLGETTNASIAVIPKYASLGGMLLNNLSASVTRHKGKGGDVENPAAGMRYALVKATENQMGRAVRKQFFDAYDGYIEQRPELPYGLLATTVTGRTPTQPPLQNIPAPSLTTLHLSSFGTELQQLDERFPNITIQKDRYEELLFKERQLEALDAGYKNEFGHAYDSTDVLEFYGSKQGRIEVVYDRQQKGWRVYAEKQLFLNLESLKAWTRAA